MRKKRKRKSKKKKKRGQYKISQEMRVSKKTCLNGWFRPQTLVQKLDSTFSGFDSTDSLIMISSSAGQTALSTTTFVGLVKSENYCETQFQVWLETHFTTTTFICVEKFLSLRSTK